MIAGPLLPDGAPKPFDRTQRFIAGNCAGAILLPWPPVAANRDDSISIAFGDCGMALFGVVRAVPTNAADLLIAGICASRLGRTGTSPMEFVVTSTARISSVSASIPIWTLRHWRR